MDQYRPTGFRVLPDVVKNILIINGLFFLATIVLQTTYNLDITEYLGLHYPGSSAFKPYQLITYMFMHGGFGHLFFNMFAVWMFGNVLENYWGPKRFLIYYIITGIGAALVHYAVVYFQIQPTINAINIFQSNPTHENLEAFLSSSYFQVSSTKIDILFKNFIHQYNILINTNPAEATTASIEFMNQYKDLYLNSFNVIGASGAVFGILLAFGMIFPNTIIYLYFAIPIKAKYFVMIYGGLELYSAISNNPNDNVAHIAHLGGMIFGFLLIKYWSKRINKNYF